MANQTSSGPEFNELEFMFADEGTWQGSEYSYKSAFWHRSIADVEAVIESDFSDEEPAPLATFKQDFSAQKWKSAANFDEITQHVSDWAKYLSDPDEPQYLEIPFPESFREMIRNQFQMDAGLDLIRTSRAMREYFKFWARYREAVVSDSSLVRPEINRNWNFGCSGVLVLFIFLFIATGIQTDNMGGAAFFIILFGAGIYWLLRSGRRSVDRRNREFEEKVQDATSELVKAKKKLTGFLERNTWFLDALDEVVAAADEEAEKFIAKQEVVLAKRRAENMFIDSSELENQNALNEQGTFSKAVPRKMERFSPRDYEIFCAGWVEYLGGKNVRVTQQSADGGIDIISDNEVAQVKLHGSPVAVQPIRELFGVSQSLSKTPLFFTSTGYTQAAITFAEANDIFLFIADPVKEDLRGVTEMSKALKRTGLSLNRDSDEAFDEISEGNAHSGVEGYEDGTATDGYFNR